MESLLKDIQWKVEQNTLIEVGLISASSPALTCSAFLLQDLVSLSVKDGKDCIISCVHR